MLECVMSFSRLICFVKFVCGKPTNNGCMGYVLWKGHATLLYYMEFAGMWLGGWWVYEAVGIGLMTKALWLRLVKGCDFGEMLMKILSHLGHGTS